MRSYRTYLRSVGRKSISGLQLRTEKKPGDIELVWDARERDHVPYRHGEAVEG